MCTHEQCKRSDYNQVILVSLHVDEKHTLETCDDPVDNEDISTLLTVSEHTHIWYPHPPPPINIKPDLGFPRE